MKKLLVMVSALTAAVFSAAKADISTSGSYGFHAITGGNVSDGDSASTSGTLFMQGGSVSFAMSTTTAGGMTVSASAGLSLDTNDYATAKAVSGLRIVNFAADRFSIAIGDVDQVGSGTGHVGNVASDVVDNGGYTASGINTGIGDTEGYGFIAKTTVGSASVSLGYLLDKTTTGINNAETSTGDYSSGLAVSMPMGDLTIGLGYASTTGGTSVNETTQGVSVAYALPAATMKVGYESSDLSTDASTMAVSFSGSLDADTTWAIGYTDGEQGTSSSTRTEAKITRSLGGGVSVYGELQSLSGSTAGSGGTGTGTNMAVGTTVAF
jgi:hypothetical protein